MDPTMVALSLAVSAQCAIAVSVMVAVVATREHRIGWTGQFVGIASGISGVGLSAVAVLMAAPVLPMVVGGALGAGLIGTGLGLALSETVRALPAGRG